MAYKYTTGAVGGTFDLLHEGHKALLRFAFSLAEKVYVTITSDVYTARFKPHAHPFVEREKAVKEFLEKEGLLQRAKIVAIDDVYGTTSVEAMHIQVIFVTEDSLIGAEKVNEKRKEEGLPMLHVEIFPLVKNDAGITLSSTFLKKETTRFILPQELRKELQRPFGKVVESVEEYIFSDTEKIITVGDVTTKILHHHGFSPILSLIDFLVGRKKQETSLEALGISKQEIILHVQNPPHEITPSLWEVLEKAFAHTEKREKTVIIVDGEEDLAVLPALLLAPVGFVLCYGQPHVGMVIIEVTKETKQYAMELLSRFTLESTRGH